MEIRKSHMKSWDFEILYAFRVSCQALKIWHARGGGRKFCSGVGGKILFACEAHTNFGGHTHYLKFKGHLWPLKEGTTAVSSKEMVVNVHNS